MKKIVVCFSDELRRAAALVARADALPGETVLWIPGGLDGFPAAGTGAIVMSASPPPACTIMLISASYIAIAVRLITSAGMPSRCRVFFISAETSPAREKSSPGTA